MGNTPWIHTDALHLSQAAACWPGWHVQPPWQGDKGTGHLTPEGHHYHSGQAKAQPGTGSTHSLPGTHHGLGPQCCRTGPLCELTRHFLSCSECKRLGLALLVIWKPAVLKYFYFYWCSGFNSCKLLRSFAKPVAKLQLSLA